MIKTVVPPGYGYPPGEYIASRSSLQTPGYLRQAEYKSYPTPLPYVSTIWPTTIGYAHVLQAGAAASALVTFYVGYKYGLRCPKLD